MVANTIAISSCHSGIWTIQYHWRPPVHGHKVQRAFFDSGTHAFRYWPLDGFVYEKTLYVALLRVEITSKTKPFGFKFIGVDLAKIANPDDEPGKWSITYLPLSKSLAAAPGVSIVVRGPYALMFGTMDRGEHKRHAVILTRISLDHLDQPDQSLEYLGSDDKWESGPIHADAKDVISEGQSDFSIRYHSEIAKWVMVQQAPGYLTSQIGIRTSANLEGPWSPFVSLMNIPEMQTPHSHSKKIFCYAAKEHPSFESSPDTLVVTYVCNSLKLLTLIHDMTIYHPIVIQLRMPSTMLQRNCDARYSRS